MLQIIGNGFQYAETLPGETGFIFKLEAVVEPWCGNGAERMASEFWNPSTSVDLVSLISSPAEASLAGCSGIEVPRITSAPSQSETCFKCCDELLSGTVTSTD